MAEAEQRRTKTAHDLYCEMSAFISDNRNSSQVDLRWLSNYLAENVSKLVSDVRNGGLNDEQKRMVADFRLGEIAAEKSKREKEIADLDREAQKLSV